MQPAYILLIVLVVCQTLPVNGIMDDVMRRDEKFERDEVRSRLRTGKAVLAASSKYSSIHFSEDIQTKSEDRERDELVHALKDLLSGNSESFDELLQERAGNPNPPLKEDDLCWNPNYPIICSDKILCVKEDTLCDGTNNCLDGSDEKDCAGGAGGRSSGCSSGSLVEGQCSNPTGNAECNIGLDDIRQQMLDPHNFYRCKHGSPQLQLSSQLNDYAQEWAEELAATDSSEHSTNRGSNPPNRGENIWTGYDVFRWQSYDQFTGSTPVSDWYSEIVNYDFASGTLNSSNEHFTQLVWKSSDQLGCGIATAQRAYGPKFYVVCQYEPAGNFGNFDLNVPPLV